MAKPNDDQFTFQIACLGIAPGTAGGGMVRYAAAMYFFQNGLLSSAALEVYRALAKDDAADPLVSLHAIGRDIEVAEIRKDRK